MQQRHELGLDAGRQQRRARARARGGGVALEVVLQHQVRQVEGPHAQLGAAEHAQARIRVRERIEAHVVRAGRPRARRVVLATEHDGDRSRINIRAAKVDAGAPASRAGDL